MKNNGDSGKKKKGRWSEGHRQRCMCRRREKQEEKTLKGSQETVACGFLCSCQWAEWFLSEHWGVCTAPGALPARHWDRCLFKRLACQTESATDGQTLS